MEVIHSTIDDGRDMIHHACKGIVTLEEIREKIQAFYQSTPTQNVIWDFTEADMSGTKTVEIDILAKSVQKMAHSREKGKTAIVTPQDLTYGLARMYQTFAEIIKGTISSIQVFRTLQEAKTWIEQK